MKTLSNLSGDVNTQLAIVRQSIEKGWIGFFAIKNNQDSTEKKEEKSFEQEVEDFKRLLDKEGISYED